MNFGVIGPGNIGEVIVRKLRDAGYPVKMANSRGPESLKDLGAKTGAIPVSLEQVVQDVDVLFLVVPQKAIPELPKGLLNKARKETIVIDVGNYYPFRDGRMGVATLRHVPSSLRIEPLLILGDMKIPVGIEVAAQIGSSEFDDGFGHRSGPAHPRPLHAVLD
jgi:predicted dinucleotide-binding enzyme